MKVLFDLILDSAIASGQASSKQITVVKNAIKKDIPIIFHIDGSKNKLKLFNVNAPVYLSVKAQYIIIASGTITKTIDIAV